MHNRNDQPLQAALNRLEKLSRARPELSQLAQLNERLLGILFAKSQPRDVHWEPSPAAEAAWDAGVPLFRALPIPIDADELRSRWLDVCDILAQQGAVEAWRGLAHAVASRLLNPARQLTTVLSHGTTAFRDELVRLQLDVSLGFTVLRMCSLPALAPAALRAEQLLREATWRGGQCRMCGSWPLLAELRGLERQRWLRCGLCAAQWHAERLFCPFCDHVDHQQLHELRVEGDEQRYGLTVCERCGGALPSLATLDRLYPPELLIAEMETLHLRFVAEQQGYWMGIT